MQHFILFIVMLIGGLLITAAIGSTMDAHVVDQEQQREQAHHSIYAV